MHKKDESNVTSIEFEQSEIARLAEELKRDTIHWLDYQRTLARIRRGAYQAYIDEGFDPEQALILCQTSLL